MMASTQKITKLTVTNMRLAAERINAFVESDHEEPSNGGNSGGQEVHQRVVNGGGKELSSRLHARVVRTCDKIK
jgi:hypothetical protein